ncbi:hypothetical protein GGI20_005219 [Coemansia sp. BCRC 34301]|nr:hypothetical protein GGI20_005219 [Coemansia sp. BCRC 34301]
MRLFAVLAIFSCLLVLCSSTYVGIRNSTYSHVVEVRDRDTTCIKSAVAFAGSANEIAVSGYPTSYFANDDCTNLVGIAYHSAWLWQPLKRPVRSYSVLQSW